MQKRGFYFTTKRSTLYYYDDLTGNVRYCKDEIKDNTVIYGNEKEEILNIEKEKIKAYLDLHGFQQLKLIVTEECNLRCRYCVYSGNYSNNRTHISEYMNFETAKMAIDKYLLSFKNIKYKNPIKYPCIGFFGGEPLLNYKLINKVINYSKKIYKNKILYSITTNALLLDDDKIKFLASNKVELAISLNGNKSENDRLRVLPNGNGTYDIILKKLNRIRTLYPEYYKKHCSILIVYDTGTDLLKLSNFICENSDILPRPVMINAVSSYFTNWYDQYSKEDKIKFKESVLKLRDIYIKQVKKGEVERFLALLFGKNFYEILNRYLNIGFNKLKPDFLKYTGACVPGSKVAVDTKGYIHCCERVPQSRPIGTVKDGIDYDKISELLHKYNNEITSKCINCPIQRLCTLCYAHLLDSDGEFRKSDAHLCNNLINIYIKRFSFLWGLLEDGAKPENFTKIQTKGL